MRWAVIVSLFLLLACKQGNKAAEQNITTLDSNAASNVAVSSQEETVLQTFSQIPIAINGCSGLFIPDTAAPSSSNYVIATDLKGTAFVKLNNRLLELKLVRQTNVDSTTIYELYTNEEVEVDLKIKQIKQSGDELWDYNGVLVLRREGKSYAVPIKGKLGC